MTTAAASLLFVLPLFWSSQTSSAFVAVPPSPSAFRTSTQLQPLKQTTIMSASSSLQEIEVIRQPDQAFLEKKGVFSWGTWGCEVSAFPWTYDQSESCYLLQGQVTVTPTDGQRQPATFGKGDFVTFPAGMSCTWDVKEAVQKHFMFY